MDFLQALKAEVAAALASDGWLLSLSHFDCSCTRWKDAPLDESVVFDEAVGNQLLVLRLHLDVDFLDDKIVAQQTFALMTGTSYAVN